MKKVEELLVELRKIAETESTPGDTPTQAARRNGMAFVAECVIDILTHDRRSPAYGRARRNIKEAARRLGAKQ